MADRRRNLLWVDGLGAVAAGVAMLLLSEWLGRWYRLPPDFVRLLAGVNLAFGAFSLPLAASRRRPLRLVVLLAVANLGWAVLCLRWTVRFWDSASWLGLVHLAAEGLYVGALGWLEWRWRRLLGD